MSVNLTQQQIKILSLLALHSAGDILPETSLNDILTSNDLNPLMVSEAIGSLIDDKHIARYSDGQDSILKITSTGLVICDQLKKDVPVTLREKVAVTVTSELAHQRSKASVTCETEPTEDGFYVNASLVDDGATLLSLKLFTPTKFQADLISKNFTASPADIYKKIITSLTESNK